LNCLYKTPQPIISTIQVPYLQVNIYSLQELGGDKAYFINEVKLSDEQRTLLKKVTEIISKEMERPKNGEKPTEYLNSEAKRHIKKYKLAKKGKLDDEKWQNPLLPPTRLPRIRLNARRHEGPHDRGHLVKGLDTQSTFVTEDTNQCQPTSHSPTKQHSTT
jgi:hypothetical protein